MAIVAANIVKVLRNFMLLLLRLRGESWDETSKAKRYYSAYTYRVSLAKSVG